MMPSLSGPLLLHSFHTLAGVRTAEALSGAGFRNFSVLPSPVPDLLWLNSSIATPLGPVIVNWFKAPAQPSAADSTLFFLEVVLPPGAAAMVGVPCAGSVDSFEDGELVHVDSETTSGRCFVDVGSGQHFFNSTLPAAFAGTTTRTHSST